jgi:hypothetical protein
MAVRKSKKMINANPEGIFPREWTLSTIMRGKNPVSVYQRIAAGVGSRIRDRAKAEPRFVKKIADPAIFNQSSGKSVQYSHADFVGQAKHLKSRSLLHLTSKG